MLTSNRKRIENLRRDLEELDLRFEALVRYLKLVCMHGEDGRKYSFKPIPKICNRCQHVVGPYQNTAMSAFVGGVSIPPCKCDCHKIKRRRRVKK